MEWISVKERLPKKRGRYLVLCDDGSASHIDVVQFTTKYTGDRGLPKDMVGRAAWFTYNDFHDFEIDNVSYWMPLPDSPNAPETDFCGIPIPGCYVCANDYHKEIECRLYLHHTCDKTTVHHVETSFCPNCGRRLS